MSKTHAAKSVAKVVVNGFVGEAKRIITSSSAQRLSQHVVMITETKFILDPVLKKSELLPDILALMGRGWRIKEIGQLLAISPSYIYQLLHRFKH